MRSSKQQPLQPGPHLPGLVGRPRTCLLLKQAQERMPLSQAIEVGVGKGARARGRGWGIGAEPTEVSSESEEVTS